MAVEEIPEKLDRGRGDEVQPLQQTSLTKAHEFAISHDDVI